MPASKENIGKMYPNEWGGLLVVSCLRFYSAESEPGART